MNLTFKTRVTVLLLFVYFLHHHPYLILCFYVLYERCVHNLSNLDIEGC